MILCHLVFTQILLAIATATPLPQDDKETQQALTGTEKHRLKRAIDESRLTDSAKEKWQKHQLAPQLILIGGGVGSCRSKLRSKAFMKLCKRKEWCEGMVLISTDDTLAKMQELTGAAKEDICAAGKLISKASSWTMPIFDLAKAAKKHIIYDSTMDSPNRVLATKKEYEAAGYSVQVIAAAADIETAAKSAIAQAKLTGRYTAMPFFLKSHNQFIQAFKEAKDPNDSNNAKKGYAEHFDQLELWELNDPASEKLIFANGNAKDSAKYEKFLKQPEMKEEKLMANLEASDKKAADMYTRLNAECLKK